MPPAKTERGAVSSWSRKAAARNTAFLRAQPRRGFDDGDAFAATLTLGRCPDTHEEWQRLRKAFVNRLRRAGLVRLHWVTEWTRRGWPHLHCSVWLPHWTGDEAGVELIRRHWLEVTEGHRTLARGQSVEPMKGFGGWARYVGKHAARGAGHYQRARDALPEGWQGTGRMWGHCGAWSVVEAVPTELTMREFHQLRRLVRAFEVGKARRRGDPRGARAARRMLRCTDPKVSAVRGMSVWSDYEGQELRLLETLIRSVTDRRALGRRAARQRFDLRHSGAGTGGGGGARPPAYSRGTGSAAAG